MVVVVAVLGAGINGLACAVKIKENYPDYKVVILSNEFTPNTTGDGSGGLWYPYLCGSTAEDKLIKWGLETYQYLHQLWLEGQDVCLMPCYYLHHSKKSWSKPAWADVVFGYRPLDGALLKYLNGLYSADYKAGHTFNTFVHTPSSTLNYLTNRFKSLNGEVIQARVDSLEDSLLAQFDVVVNCLGASAQTVVPDDRVHSIRGQVSKVVAPWLNETIMDDELGLYIIPNVRMCVMGGTHQRHDYNRTVDDKDTAFIFKGCHSLVPSLKHAKTLNHWVGLRPARDEVRLEAERRNGKLFIHNYGHGGSGLTLFWGCATEVLQLLDKNLNKHNLSKL